MKLGFIADLHIDRNRDYDSEAYLNAFVQLISDNQLDYLFLGGDISNHYQLTIRFVEELQRKSKIKIYFIPGNHDYWETSKNKKDIDSWQVHHVFKNHPQCLMNHPVIINDQLGITGHPLWYDHTVHASQFAEADFETGKYRMATWQDKRHINWRMSDPEVSKIFAKELEEELAHLSAQVSNVLLVTHVISLTELAIPMPNKVFDFFNAFIATKDIEPFYQKFPIRYSFMGHVHHRYQLTKNGINYIINSLGYRREWQSDNFQKELNSALSIILTSEFV